MKTANTLHHLLAAVVAVFVGSALCGCGSHVSQSGVSSLGGSAKLADVASALSQIFAPDANGKNGELDVTNYHCGRVSKNGYTTAVSACLQFSANVTHLYGSSSSILLRILAPFTSAQVIAVGGRIGQMARFPTVLSEVTCTSGGALTGYADQFENRPDVLRADLVCHHMNDTVGLVAVEVRRGHDPQRPSRGAIVLLTGSGTEGEMLVEENAIPMTMK